MALYKYVRRVRLINNFWRSHKVTDNDCGVTKNLSNKQEFKL